MDTEIDQIRLMGDHLAIGETLPNRVCPYCGGGKSQDRSFAISRTGDGNLAFICYRASCGRAGYIRDGGYNSTPRDVKQSGKPVRKIRPYTGVLWRLATEDRDYFEQRFHLDMDAVDTYIRLNEDQRYAIRVTGPLNEHYGWVLREPWKGKPACPRSGAGYTSKTILHMERDVEPICVYQAYKGYGPHPNDTVVIVEDQISALRLWQMNYKAVALLGTHLNMARVRIIQRLRARRTVFALDPDATDKAFEFARKWGLALPSVRVALLEKDIKDMGDDTEIKDAIGD